jgi:hypothetical protein
MVALAIGGGAELGTLVGAYFFWRSAALSGMRPTSSWGYAASSSLASAAMCLGFVAMVVEIALRARAEERAGCGAPHDVGDQADPGLLVDGDGGAITASHRAAGSARDGRERGGAGAS